MKKTYFMLCVMLTLLISACGGAKESKGSDGKDAGGITQLSLWVFSKGYEPTIARFEEQNPNIKIDVTIVPNAEYPTKIRPVLRNGRDAPDLFVGEGSYVRKWAESGDYWTDLGQFNPDTSEIMPYVLALGRDVEGKLRALSWQATPGGTFYRRSYAKEYFGTDDPAVIAEKFASVDAMIASARELKEKSGGKVKFFGSRDDYQPMFLAGRNEPFVTDGKFNYKDPALRQAAEFSRLFYQEDLDGKVQQWTPAWFNGMKKDGNVFAYLLPTWGYEYVLKRNAPDSSGDWALTSSPTSWYSGGTWMGIYKNSEKKEAAWKFLEFMTLDRDYLKWRAKETGDFLAHRGVVAEIKDSFSEEYLGGQNHYEYFAQEAPKIKGNLFTKYDADIGGFYLDSLGEYVEGRAETYEDMLDYFKTQVKTALPDLIVE